MKKAKVIVAHQGQYISFFKENRWEYVKRNNCTGVVIILAKTDDQKILLVEQYRPPVRKYVIEFPAGLISDLYHKQNESVISAAKRELFEETGYKAKEMVKLLSGPISSGLTSDLVTFVLASGLKKVSNGGGDGTENIRVHEVALSEVENFLNRKIKQKILVDPKIYTGLYFFNKYN